MSLFTTVFKKRYINMKKIILIILAVMPVALFAQEKSTFTNLKKGIHVEIDEFNYLWGETSFKLTRINLFEYNIQSTKTFRSESKDALIQKANDWVLKNTYAYNSYTIHKGISDRNFKWTLTVPYGTLTKIN